MTAGFATAIMSVAGLWLGKLAANAVRIRTDLFGGVVLFGMAGLTVVHA